MYFARGRQSRAKLSLKFLAYTTPLLTVFVMMAAFVVARSGGNHRDALIGEADPLPWEKVSSNQRVHEHQEAARFLTQLNFYQDGHGLVQPPSFTMERIEAAFGVEQFANTAGLPYDDGKLYGMTIEKYGSKDLLVTGCAACHIGKAAGVMIPGLGSKTTDLFGLAQATKDKVNAVIDFDSQYKATDQEWQQAHQAGVQAFQTLIEHEEYDAGTAGLVNLFFAVAMAFKKSGLPPLEKPLFAPVKAPSLWGYGPKRQVGVFSDGLMKGSPAGAAGLPLFIGNYTLEVFEENMDNFEAAEKQFEKLLPPEYPFQVDRDLATRGQNVFTARCAECHGEHHRDDAGLPLFHKPMLVILEEIGTDPLRATAYDDSARVRFQATPFAKHLHESEHEPGYLAPNLWGIWSRFPYLHNGSVANIADLLLPPEERPIYIDLVDIGERHRFSSQRLGATATSQADAARRAQNKDRWVYNANRQGFSNAGHDYGTDLPGQDKRALIEYLKTL